MRAKFEFSLFFFQNSRFPHTTSIYTVNVQSIVCAAANVCAHTYLERSTAPAGDV
jgi:hypothetical protein